MIRHIIFITLSAILLFACKSKPEKAIENTTDNLVYERIGDNSTNTWGYRDNHGNMIIPFGIYSFLQEDEKGMILAHKYDKQGYIDIHQNILIPFEYDDICIFFEDLAFAKKDNYGKYGVIDRQGNIIIPFLYDRCSYFYPDGLAAVKKNELYGFIDKQGHEVIPIQYEEVNHTTFDKVVLAKSKGKWAFFSNAGKQLTPFQYDEIVESIQPRIPKQNPNFKTKHYSNISYSLFSNNRVLVKQNNRYHYLDTNLQRTALSRDYTYAEPFNQNTITIVAYKGGYGIIDSAENFVLSPTFTKIEHPKPYPTEYSTPNDNFFITNKKQLIRILNKHLEPISNDEYKTYQLHRFNSGDSCIYLFNILNKADKMGLIDQQGRVLVPFEYQSIQFLPPCIAIKNRKYGIITPFNELLYPFTCDEIEKVYSTNDFIAKQGKKYGLIDSSGQEILPFEYEDITPYDYNARNNFIVKQNGKYGIIDRNQKIIIPIEFDDIISWVEYSLSGVHHVLKNGKKGVYSQDGKILIPPVYDYLYIYTESLIEVQRNNKWGIINLQDSVILPVEFDIIYIDYDWEMYPDEHPSIYTKKNNEYNLYDVNCKFVKEITKEEFDKKTVVVSLLFLRKNTLNETIPTSRISSGTHFPVPPLRKVSDRASRQG